MNKILSDIKLRTLININFASTVTLLMPIVAIIWGFLDGDKLSAMQFAGAGIIIAGLIFLRAKPNVIKK